MYLGDIVIKIVFSDRSTELTFCHTSGVILQIVFLWQFSRITLKIYVAFERKKKPNNFQIKLKFST